jgi:hypothetical protein
LESTGPAEDTLGPARVAAMVTVTVTATVTVTVTASSSHVTARL